MGEKSPSLLSHITMLETIKLINTQIDEMRINTAIWLEPLEYLLIKLSAIYWEKKEEAKQGKTSYEVNTITQKDIREKELIKDNAKVTDSELERYAKKQLVKDYQAYKDLEAVCERLDPIIKSYYEYANGVKFDAREWTKVNKFNSDFVPPF